MWVSEIRDQVISQTRGAMALNIAFIGISNPLFSILAEMEQASPENLADRTGLDPGYVHRWCDAAFAFGLLDEKDGLLRLSELGRAFVPETPDTVMPFAVQSVLSARIAEMAARFMKTGERPGDKILAESESILPLFGPMLEAMYGRFFEERILPNVPVYKETDEKGGLVVDLGCGNGWYLRKIAAHLPHLRGIGIDAIDENISQARKLAQKEGLADRLTFRVDDIHQRTFNNPSDLIVMNRALHHVWDEREAVFLGFKNRLKSGGSVVIWEPNWPRNRSELRDPGKLPMAFQNLAEYVQGNRFLRADEIEAEFHRTGMETQVRLFADGNEAIIVGRKS